MATDIPARSLTWTGERYMPQIGGETGLEHLHRYYWAAQFCGAKRVLDIACGEGYGSDILARSATHVIGVDRSEAAVVHAARKYRRNNLEFLVGSCDRIPIPDGQIDLVVSFETIEHHDQHREMMREIKRILCPEGILIISSPDKYVYSDIAGYKNEFHVKELYAREFQALLKEHFGNVDVLSQRVAYGSIIAGEGGGVFLSFDSKQKSPPAVGGIERAVFNVAIAADGLLPQTFSSIYEQSVTKSGTYQALQREVEARDLKLHDARMHEEAAISELREELAKLRQGVLEAERQIKQLKASLSWRITWPLRLVRDRLATGVSSARKAFSNRSAKAAGTPENSQRTIIAALFDERYYTGLNPGALASGSAPVEHYLARGWKEGLKPHPLFDPSWYLRENPDVAKAGVEPLYHYLLGGWRDGRSPHPLFDVRYYLSQAPELAELGIEPVSHFLRHGAQAGLKPNPLFDPVWYAGFNRQSMSPGQNPLAHYVTRGWKEGCDPHPSFNISLYLEANPEIRSGDEDPLLYHLRRSRSESVHLMADIGPEPPGAETEPPEMDVKAIALYLPEFQRILEEDAWWGEGLMEWTNVRRGRPQFWDHYQPHVPHPDIGYYDLIDASVMEKQAQMARQFGIYGFCFYYYWFNGRRLLQMPTDRLLSSGKPDFPFCFCWANENWTRRRDGEEDEVLIAHKHSYENDERFIQDLLPALRDRRYIRVNGRPLVAVYRPEVLPDPKGTFSHWRGFCRREGIGEIYLAGFKTFDLQDPEAFGMDAAVEFPPHCNVTKSGREELAVFNDFCGEIYDYREIAENLLTHPASNFTLFRGVMPGWDNTARMQKRAIIWAHSNPQLYCRWLHRAVLQTRRHANPDERLIFINSWNDWAGGSHLEPDERHGYAWLNATRLALETGSSRRRAAGNSDVTQEPQPESAGAKPCEKQLLVSVIVPNYNHERYLPERLRSIAGQTYQNMEIILLDDASTDNSRAILQKFSSEESRARFIPNAQNSGSTFKQWRRGLSQARGKYVWIAESDDGAEPEFLETLVGKLESDPGLSLAYCQLQIVSPNGEMFGTPEEPWLNEIDPVRWKKDFVNEGIDEIRRSMLMKNAILNASGVVFRNAEGIADLVDDSMRLCADWLFWVRLLQRGGVSYVAKPLSRWRLHSSNARTRPAGELEWLEGERVLVEAAEILKLTQAERDRILLNFLRKCWKWRVEAAK